MDAARALALFDSYDALAAGFPPLSQMVDALLVERRELAAAPNLTQARPMRSPTHEPARPMSPPNS